MGEIRWVVASAAAVTVAAVAVGCSGAPTAEPPPPGSAARSATGATGPVAPRGDYAPPAPATPAPYERTCERWPPGYLVDTQLPEIRYDFEKVPLRPLPYGPRIAEMPRDGHRRTMNEVLGGIARQRDHLTDCWKWTRRRNRKLPDQQLTLHMTVSPRGIPREIRLDNLGDDELATCLREGLEAVYLTRFTARETRVALDIRLAASSQKRAPRTRRPSRPTRRLPVWADCVQLPASVPTDELTSDGVALVIDDFVAPPARKRGKGKRGKGKRKPDAPEVAACTPAVPITDKADLRRMIRANLGTYRACYAAALERAPNLRGTARVHAVLGTGGTPIGVKVEVAPAEAQLASCLTKAFEELLLQPAPIAMIGIDYTFELTPDATAAPPPADPIVRARHHIDSGNAAGAIADYTELLRSRPDDRNGCLWRVGVLRAALDRAPWGLGPQVARAADDVITTALAAGDTACLEQAAPMLAQVALFPQQRPLADELRGGLVEALDRARALLDRAPALPTAASVQLFVASAHAELGEWDAAERALAVVEGSPGAAPHRDDIARIREHIGAGRDKSPPNLRSPLCGAWY